MKKSIWWILSLVMIIAMIPATVMAAQSDDDMPSSETSIVVTEEVSDVLGNLCVGDNYQIDYQVINGSGETTIKSTNEYVLSVDEEGNCEAKFEGQCELIIRNNDAEVRYNVSVKEPYLDMSDTIDMYLKGKYTIAYWTGYGGGTPEFTSSNTSIATVSSAGVVTAKRVGVAIITAEYRGYTMSFTVEVEKPYLKAKSKSLYQCKTYKISIVGGVGTPKYTSSNKKVATVSKYGKVKAVKPGKATIYVKTNGITLKFKVTVKSRYYSGSYFKLTKFQYYNGCALTKSRKYPGDYEGAYYDIKSSCKYVYYYKKGTRAQAKEYAKKLKAAGWKSSGSYSDKVYYCKTLSKRSGKKHDVVTIEYNSPEIGYNPGVTVMVSRMLHR